MTALALGDVHWSANPRDQYRHDFVERQLLPLIRAKRVSRCILLGDLTDSKDKHGAVLVNRVVGHLHTIAQLCPLHVVCGNHDFAVAGHPFFEFLGHIDNISWWTQPTELGHASWPNTLMLPHSHDWERDWPLDKIKQGGYDFIFAHATFTGARSESGREMEGVPTSIFADDARVVAGDVHVPQRVGPVIYAGAPYRINFGDSFQPRVLLLRGDKIVSVQVGGPRKVLIDTVADDDLDRDDNTEPVVKSGDIVKVRVHLTGDEYARWGEIKDMWRAWAAEQQVELMPLVPVLERADVRGSAPRRAEVVPDEQVLASYGRARQVDEPTMSVGQEIAREI